MLLREEYQIYSFADSRGRLSLQVWIKFYVFCVAASFNSAFCILHLSNSQINRNCLIFFVTESTISKGEKIGKKKFCVIPKLRGTDKLLAPGGKRAFIQRDIRIFQNGRAVRTLAVWREHNFHRDTRGS